MKLRSKLTCAGIVTLMLTSSPLMLLVLPSRYFQVHASGLSNVKPGCRFPDFLQTKKNWMMDQSDTITTFDVEGGRIYARYGACRSGQISYPWRRQSGTADCTKSNYTRICQAKKGNNRYLVRHIESTFGDKFACMEFLKRGISVVQVKMSRILDEHHVHSLCDPDQISVDPWPWISEEHYRSPAVDCPFSAGLNLHLEYSTPIRTTRYVYDYSHSSSYSSSSENNPNPCTESTTAPIRIESDCVSREGIVFHFKHESCLPAGSHLALRQRALCMATWSQDGEDFAMLRADNNDRNFFCLRVSYDSNSTNDVKQVALFDGWVCPTSYDTDAARRFSTIMDDSFSRTPHMVFSVRSKHVITEPCSDELSTCHSRKSFCRGLHCMRTCGKCFPSRDSSGANRKTSTNNMDASPSNIHKKATLDTSSRFALLPSHASVRDDSQPRSSTIFGDVSGDSYGDTRDDVNGDLSGDVKIDDREDSYDGFNANSNSVEEKEEPTDQGNYRRPCTFPEDMRGAWLQRTVDGTDEQILITDSTLHHPTLGDLECITFSLPSDDEVPLRRVLWGHYDNGCYPRFTCVHYNTPAKSVMRYRLADMQQWPLQLSDDAICDEKHFLEPPDMYQPGDKYSARSWEVVRREGTIYRMACVLPHNFPRVVSFMDDRGRSGCFVHGTYYSPRAISLSFFPEEDRRGGNSLPRDDNLGRDDTQSSSNRKEEGEGNTDGNFGGSFTGYNEQGTNAFRGNAVWNGTGSDGTYYAVDPYADAHYGSNERLSQDSSTHGRYLKRSRVSVKNIIVRTQASVNDAKTPHSRKHKTKDGAVPDDYTANTGTDSRQRRRRDINQQTFHTDTAPPSKYHRTKDDNKLKHHRGSKRDNKSKYHHKSNVEAVENYTTSKTHDSSALLKDNVLGIEKHNVSRSDKDTNLLRISALLYNTDDVRGLSPASSSLHNDNAPGKSDHKYNTHKQPQRHRRHTNLKSRSNAEQHSYECLAVMTYVDSYKSLLTITEDNPSEILCWLVVDEYTVVILKTSSCNSQTAQRVLEDHARLSKHGQHAHRILRLHQGEKDCDAMFPADEIWPEPVQILNQQASNSGVSYHMRTVCLSWNVLCLSVLLLTLTLYR